MAPGRKKIVAAHEPIEGDLHGGVEHIIGNGSPPPQMPFMTATPKLTPTTMDKLGAMAGPNPMPAIAGNIVQGPPPLVPTQVNYPQVSAEPQPLKVALIGTAPSSRMLAPFNDLSWEIWACSPGNQGILPRVTIWFELHGNLLWPEHKSYGEPYLEWIKKLQIPVYMQDKSLVPNAIPFPMEEMVKEFGPHFFSSSFVWMMALAMTKGAKEIGLYGIDMASRDEYILQRPGFYYFLEKARSRGIKVTAPNESDIMQPPALYGYSDVTPQYRKTLARKAELKGRIADLNHQIAQKEHELMQLKLNKSYLEGAHEDVDYYESIWGSNHGWISQNLNGGGQGVGNG